MKLYLLYFRLAIPWLTFTRLALRIGMVIRSRPTNKICSQTGDRQTRARKWQPLELGQSSSTRVNFPARYLPRAGTNMPKKAKIVFVNFFCRRKRHFCFLRFILSYFLLNVLHKHPVSLTLLFCQPKKVSFGSLLNLYFFN